MSTTNVSFLSYCADHLLMLDMELAANNVPIDRRPIQAAISFARNFVLQVGYGERQWTPNFDSSDFLSERWFSGVYMEIDHWYRKRFPAAFTNSTHSTLTGLVLIWGSPFALRVPLTVTRPGEPGKTIWLSFPDYLLDTENPTNWIVDSPDLSQLTRNELTKLTESADKIASLIRLINAQMIGVMDTDDVVRRFLDTLRGNISRGALADSYGS